MVEGEGRRRDNRQHHSGQLPRRQAQETGLSFTADQSNVTSTAKSLWVPRGGGPLLATRPAIP
jgi:hypothetical protein